MIEKNESNNNLIVILLFFLIPTIMLIIGYFIFPYPPSDLAQKLVNIPLFLGLFLLGIGFFQKNKKLGAKIKIIGWGIFAFFWSTSPAYLYLSEEGDIFNASVAIIGVYILTYLAYHEWLSIKKDEYISCLDWIAGGSFIAGIIYFSIDSNLFPILKEGLINIVAAHSVILLNIFGIPARVNPDYVDIIMYNNSSITIILACTAIQASVLFVGMIGALKKIGWKMKIFGILITVVPIYFLNLVRNASVVYLVGANITSFNIAHNVLAKIGALITLIALLFIIFKIIPELFDEINCIIDLPKRKGPIESFFKEKK